MAASKPTLWIEAEDFAYIKAAVAEANYREIGGLGVVVIEDGYPIVKHMRLLEQKVSSGEVEWSDSAHAEYLTWLYTSEEDGGAGFDGDRYGLYSWHSHGNMDTFYSGTDEDFIKRVGTSVPWIFSSVYNNKGKVTHRVDAFPRGSDIGCELLPEDNDRLQITWKDVDLFVAPGAESATEWAEINRIHDASEAEIDAVAAEITALEEKIKTIEAKRDEDLKPLRKIMAENAKGVQKAAKERMKEDYDTYVTTSYTPPKTVSSARGSGSSNSNSGGSSQGKGQSGGATNGTQGSGGTGSNTGRFLTSTDPYTRWFESYNTQTKVTMRKPLREIIDSPNLVLIDDLPNDVLTRLQDEDRREIALRPLKEEVGFFSHYGIGY